MHEKDNDLFSKISATPDCDYQKTLSEIMPYVIFARKTIHQKPETRWETKLTRKFIVDEMLENISQGIPHDNITIYEPEGGIVIDITTAPNGPRWLFRADMDALDILENTGLEFASVNHGKSHACGHDIHTALLLGLSKAICRGLIRPSCNLRIVFSDAEENPGMPPRPECGDYVLAEAGICQGITGSVALHINPSGKFGKIISTPSWIYANSDRLKITIACAGGHSSRPRAGANAIWLASKIINDLQVDAEGKSHCFVPTVLESGKSSNVMPSKAAIMFSLRTLLTETDRDAFVQNLKDAIAKSIKGLSYSDLQFEFIKGNPAFANTESVFRKIFPLLNQGGFETEECKPKFAGESFGHIMNRTGGCYFLLGTGSLEQGNCHTPHFNPPEEAFIYGLYFWLLLATKL